MFTIVRLYGTLIKSTLNEQTENFTEMEKALKKWLTKNDFRCALVGLLMVKVNVKEDKWLRLRIMKSFMSMVFL